MAVARLLLLCLIAACGSDSVHLISDDPIVTVRLDPIAAQVPVGGALQFTAVVRTATGADRAALISWQATVGSISSDGLFQATTDQGTALVIATCACGLADTATITITAPPPTATSRLHIGLSGLPDEAQPTVHLSGPSDFLLEATAPATLPPLLPGDYRIDADPIELAGVVYQPNPAAVTVTLMAATLDTVTIAYRQLAANGLPPHPRVWMTPARVDRLKAQAAANTIRWQRVKQAADQQLNRGDSYTTNDARFIPDLCLSYLATGDDRYAHRAARILRSHTVESRDLTGDSGYQFRFELPLATMGLDWCYHGLSIADRRQIATWLMNRADWVWPESNPERTGAHGTRIPVDNYTWGFLMTGPAALAAIEDDTGRGAISGTDRPSFHRALALEKWANVVGPMLQQEAAGGAWQEGTNYESTWRAASFVDAFNTAGEPLSSPFFAQSLRWRLHSTMPGAEFKVPFGDQPRVSTAPIFTYDRMAALYALDADPTVDPGLRTAIYAWLDQIGNVATSEFNTTATLADELLRYDPTQATGGMAADQSLGYLAPGAGYFIYRTSWNTPNATVMAFQSGPAMDHGGMAQNSLMIWKGKFWISADANVYSHSGTVWQTDRHNSMTVAGQGQPKYWGNTAEIVGEPVMSDRLVVVRGQARNAYGYPPGRAGGRNVVDNYLRTVAFLPQQDVFVIVDQVTVVDPSDTKTWRWHMKAAPQIAGRNFTLEGEARDYRCFGSVLAPSDVVVGTESFSLGLNAAAGVTSHAVTVTTPARASDVVVTVLQCTGATAAPAPATAVIGTSDATVTVGGTRVIVPFSESGTVRLE